MSQQFPIPRTTRGPTVHIATAGQSVFTFPFWLHDGQDVEVRIKPVGAESYGAPLTFGVDFTVTNLDQNGGATVTLTVARAVGDAVRLRGKRLPTRTTSVVQAGTIKSTLLELELDLINTTQQELRRDADQNAADIVLHDTRLTAAEAKNAEQDGRLGAIETEQGVQNAQLADHENRLSAAEPELADVALRAVRVPPGETGVALPSIAERAGRFLKFNPDGTPTVGGESQYEAIEFLEPGPVEDVRPRTVDNKLKDGPVSLAGYFLVIDLDHTNALRRALETGRAVLVPHGTFDISPQELNGLSGEVIGASRFGSVLRWRVDDASQSLMKVTGLNINLAFRTLTIDGQQDVIGDTAGYYASIDFQATGYSRLELDRVRFTRGRIIDVRVVGPTAASHTEFLLSGCTFDDGMVGTATRAAVCVQCQDQVRATWIGNDASLPSLPATYGRAGFLFQRGTGSPVTSYGTVVGTGNRFRNIGRGTADTLGCLDVYSGARTVVFAGNTMEDTVGRAISVKGDQSSIAITGNVVKNTKSSVAAVCTPIVLFQDLFNADIDRDLNISGNVVTGSDGYGIFIDGEGLSAARYRNALIALNVISGTVLDGIRVRFIHGPTVRGNMIDGVLANGIVLLDVDGRATVADNDIQNVATHGISGSTALTDADLHIVGNRVSGLTGGSSRGVTVDAACRSYQINDNDIDGGLIGIVTAGSTALSSIRRNRITSTNPISRSGTDTLLTYDDNLTTNSVAFATRTSTISGGVTTVWADWHWIDTEAAAATDDLDTINGGFEGRVITLYAANSSRDVVLKDGTGNLRLNGDFTMNNAQDSITLKFRQNEWVEQSRSDNAA